MELAHLTDVNVILGDLRRAVWVAQGVKCRVILRHKVPHLVRKSNEAFAEPDPRLFEQRHY